MKKNFILAIISVFILSLLLTGCGKDETVVIGADTTFPPFESMQNGNVAGFDIDLINAIAKEEGFKVKYKTMEFKGLIPSLQAKSISAAVAGITIKKSRMENVDFSNAYYHSGLSVLVRKDSDIKSFDDLKGHIIATKKATSSVDYAKANGIDEGSIKQFDSIDQAYQTLVSGGADAVLFDNPVNANFAAKNDKVKIVGDLLTGEYYGIAVAKGKDDLLKKINDGLEKVKKNGTYKKLFDKYFGGDTGGMVNDVKTPQDVALDE